MKFIDVRSISCHYYYLPRSFIVFALFFLCVCLVFLLLLPHTCLVLSLFEWLNNLLLFLPLFQKTFLLQSCFQVVLSFFFQNLHAKLTLFLFQNSHLNYRSILVFSTHCLVRKNALVSEGRVRRFCNLLSFCILWMVEEN